MSHPSTQTRRAAGSSGGSTCSGGTGAPVPLIGLAHGSRHPDVSPALEHLLAVAGEDLGVAARVAYLDLVEPDLTAVAIELAAAGERSAVVVPLLFTEAYHARVDVPDALAAATAASGLALLRAEGLGTGSDLEAVLRDSLAGVDQDIPVLLHAVGSSDASANAAVLDLGRRLGAGRSGRVRVGFATTEPRTSGVLQELLREPGEKGIVLPLFLAPGLLLDPLSDQAREHGWTVLEPLAERAAAVVARRYLDVTSAPATLH